MTAKSPEKGQWWRLVEIAANSPSARYITIQYEGYKTEPYRKDWENVYKPLWEELKDKMEPGSIGDNYSPWQPGRPIYE